MAVSAWLTMSPNTDFVVMHLHFPYIDNRKDLNADRKLSKLDVRSPFSRSAALGSLLESLSQIWRHIFSPWLNSTWWLIYSSGTFLKNPQEEYTTDTLSAPAGNIPVTQHYKDQFWLICCPSLLIAPCSSTLEEKLHNNLLIIHCYSPSSMLALSQLHRLLFSCSHANIYVTKPILCSKDG